MSEKERVGVDPELEAELNDFTDEYLHSSPSEFKEILAAVDDKKISLNVNLVDADPISIKDFLRVVGRKVTIRATQEEVDQYSKEYPSSVKWEIIS